jgi:hypothetical protein
MCGNHLWNGSKKEAQKIKPKPLKKEEATLV